MTPTVIPRGTPVRHGGPIAGLAGDTEEVSAMHRYVRTVATLALTATLTLLTGAGIAGAQEMEHGRTRPANRELQTNQVKT
ncbi:MAG: hypothetical protein ACRD12_05690 [Acidimicrobiales bacterium]